MESLLMAGIFCWFLGFAVGLAILVVDLATGLDPCESFGDGAAGLVGGIYVLGVVLVIADTIS